MRLTAALTGVLVALAVSAAAPAQANPWEPPPCSTHDPCKDPVVKAAGGWVDTHILVESGNKLIIDATGTWQDGSSVTGPTGSKKEWPDNFLNLADLGADRYSATTLTPYWNQLVAYIGDRPPARGSYTSPSIESEAKKVFPVFGNLGTSSVVLSVKNDDRGERIKGRVWLAFNGDAYSNYTSDNSGEVTVKIQADTNWDRPSPDVGWVCDLPGIPKFIGGVCWVASKFVPPSSTS